MYVVVSFLLFLFETSLKPSTIEFILLLVSDGNGFKTSTMRLGADVIVFTQNQNNGYISLPFILAVFLLTLH